MKSTRWIIGLVLVAGLLAATLQAQRYRQGGRNNFGGYYEQNNPPDSEFVFARWHYTAGRRGGGWAHDYPVAEEHILQIMREATGINVERLSYRVVELSSPEIFKYPFAYVSEPGEMDLSDEEIVNLREYVDRGGFVMVDDFSNYSMDQGGADDFQYFRRNLLRAFPDRDMFVLTDDHPLLKNFYTIDSIETVHPMTGVKSVFYGYPDAKGGLSMVICFANDVGDYWEFIDSPHYAVRPSKEALKLGINFIMYALTH